ncbi:MAG TPA: hypothetical protein VJI75_00890 [Candidatus Nanoarchaeia archaeon]|nr:hypothetical protein [Candidatus Nanoarchaeia archaeon]
MAEFRRKIYRRGSSFETTIPMPLLFALDLSKKHNVIFRYKADTRQWLIDFEEESANPKNAIKGRTKR